MSPTRHVWNSETIERQWRYLQQFPDTYFSYHRSQDIVFQSRKHIPIGASVLDYGCGPGYLIPALLDQGYRASGADLSTETIGNKVPDVKHRPNFEGFSSVSDLIKTGKQFDAAFLIEVVEHLGDKELAETFSNIQRLLKPGGALVVTTPNNERLEDNDVYCPISDQIFHRWQHVRSWNEASLSRALTAAGFKSATTRVLTFRGNRAMGSFPLRLLGAIKAKQSKPVSLMGIARA